MTPLSFDLNTAKGVIGDQEARTIEYLARIDAEKGKFHPPENPTDTYWSMVQQEMRHVIYTEQFQTRIKRIARRNKQ